MGRGKGIPFGKNTEILRDVAAGGIHADIADKHGVSRTVVTKLARRGSQQAREDTGSWQEKSRKRCRDQGACWAVLELELIDWISEKRASGCAITTSLIKCKACEIRDTLAAEGDGGSSALRGFVASNGWFERFKVRMGLCSLSILGTEDMIPVVALQVFRDVLAASLSPFLPEDIYNLDETGLFYRQDLGRSYVQTPSRCREV
jgi:hypothetical protein